MTKKLIESVMLKLTSPVTYGKAGDMADCYEIEICCHTKKQFKKVIHFKGVLTRAFFDLQQRMPGNSDGAASSDSEDESDQTIGCEEVILALNLSSDVDIEDLYERFEKLALLGILKVEGKNMNYLQFEEMEGDDIERAVATYLATFIMPSVMKSSTET